jgi:hypothetical protein
VSIEEIIMSLYAFFCILLGSTTAATVALASGVPVVVETAEKIGQMPATGILAVVAGICLCMLNKLYNDLKKISDRSIDSIEKINISIAANTESLKEVMRNTAVCNRVYQEKKNETGKPVTFGN